MAEDTTMAAIIETAITIIMAGVIMVVTTTVTDTDTITADDTEHRWDATDTTRTDISTRIVNAIETIPTTIITLGDMTADTTAEPAEITII